MLKIGSKKLYILPDVTPFIEYINANFNNSSILETVRLTYIRSKPACDIYLQVQGQHCS